MSIYNIKIRGNSSSATKIVFLLRIRKKLVNRFEIVTYLLTKAQRVKTVKNKHFIY